MPLHLIKLVVGVQTLDELLAWHTQQARLEREWRVHTRSTPKRAAEITDGGSLYRVIKGVIVCRQPVLRIDTIGEGRASRCHFVVAPEIIIVAPTARRPFQGWRYMEAKDAPPDLADIADAADTPPELLRELRELGAW